MFSAAIDIYTTLQSGIIPAATMSEMLFNSVYDRLIKRQGDPPAVTMRIARICLVFCGTLGACVPGDPVTQATPANSELSISLDAFGVPVRVSGPLGGVEPTADFRLDTARVAPLLQPVVEHVAPEIDTPSQMIFSEARLLPVSAGSSVSPGMVVRVSRLADGAGRGPCLDPRPSQLVRRAHQR